jgi:dTDP-4-dehydrorhamnose reductase
MPGKPTIVVTGANGQVGRELQDLASKYPQYHFHFFSKEQLSITDKAAVEKIFGGLNPQFLVNTAAYTAVDKAEIETETANLINGYAVGDLAEMCAKHNCRFLHISTDYVFNGTSQTPLGEDAPVDPVNAYGAGKLLGEQLARAKDPSSVIIRTSWVYSVYGNNFVKTMLRLLREKSSIRVVNDQTGCPTYAADLAETILDIISYQQWQPGIYHYCNSGPVTWFRFALEIGRQIQSSCLIEAIPSSEFPTPAKRPMYSVMDTTKIQNTFNITIKDWKESLAICLARF